MSDSNSMWPFQEISAEEGLDINEIFGTGTSNGAAAPEANPFQVPQQTAPAPEAAIPHVEQPPTSPAAPQAEQTPAPQPAAVTIPPTTIPAAEPVPSNPLEAAFEAKTVENAKVSLFEKKPVFYHKSAKEVIEDPNEGLILFQRALGEGERWVILPVYIVEYTGGLIKAQLNGSDLCGHRGNLEEIGKLTDSKLHDRCFAKPVHIQRYINEASTKYAPETVKKDFNCLKLIFDTAVDNQLCAKSPMTRSIKLPRYETVKDKHAFTQAQYDTAYAAAQEYGGLSLMLMLETGLSRSELLGLRWEDIDEENRCLASHRGWWSTMVKRIF